MKLIQLDPYRWEVPKTGGMYVPGIIYTNEHLLGQLLEEEAIKQVKNVAHLPGIIKASFAMPDVHWGYGFPIGGVAAFDWNSGVISPGGVGYDINCGVRLASTGLTKADIAPKLELLINSLYNGVPSGLGSKGPIKLSKSDLTKVLKQGSRWVVEQGMGTDTDVIHTEDGGCMQNADPKAISKRALERGKNQLGTLGSGNHFLELGVVDTIYHSEIANRFGLFKDQITLMIHSGSRGLGYQICDDFLALMNKHVQKLAIDLPDRQLACAYIQSNQGKQYYNAMACAANYAWANRQVMLHRSREIFYEILGIGPRDLNMNLVYDVCHNIAKKETHMVDGKKQVVCVHRKGATRSFAPGHEMLCETYQDIGQPILIPGDMGTASYVLIGTQHAMENTFGSTSHGAGRILSRKAAKKASRGRQIQQELEDQGVLVRWTGRSTLAEEMPDAYKDISQVIDVVHSSGISKKIAKIRPIAVIKG